LKKKRSEEKFSLAKKEIEHLTSLESAGCIDLYFGDASHFSTAPNVPYAWQKKGKQVLLPSARSKGLSVLGLLSRTSKFFHKTLEGKINSEVVADFFDEFCETLTKETVVVLDNSSVHNSKLFAEKSREWKEKGLKIYFIPPYSPELNLIEIL